MSFTTAFEIFSFLLSATTEMSESLNEANFNTNVLKIGKMMFRSGLPMHFLLRPQQVKSIHIRFFVTNSVFYVSLKLPRRNTKFRFNYT